MSMFGLAIVTASLSLMGAPNLPATCNPPSVAQYHAYGLTWWRAGTPTRIEYGGQVCAGLLYLAASPAERVKLRALNRSEGFDADAGIAVGVILHESAHASGIHDETGAECAAMTHLDAFVAANIDADMRAIVLQWARAWDASLPPAYHAAPCG